MINTKAMKQHEIRETIMSHLCDAQNLMQKGFMDEANDCINFARLLIVTYPDIQVSVSEEILAELWGMI